MQTEIPSAEQVRVALQSLSHAQVQELANASEVPFTTLWKVRSGETPNPRLETVRAFLPHVARIKAAAATPAAGQAPAPQGA